MTRELATLERPTLDDLRAASQECKCIVGVDTADVCPQCRHKPTCDRLRAWILQRRWNTDGKP